MEAHVGERKEGGRGNAITPTMTLEVVVLDRRKTIGGGAETGGGDTQNIHKLIDPKTGRTYYFNRLTGESTWDEPNEHASNGEITARKPEKPDDWVQLVDSSGRPFEYNRATADSRWIATKETKQNPATYELMIRETSERPGELYVIQNSASDQAYLYDRKTGESKDLNEIPPDAIMSSVRSDDDDSHDVETDPDNSVIDYEQETETEESEDDQMQNDDQIGDLSDLLEGLVLVRAIHEVETLFETWPSLSHFIDVFMYPHSSWSTLMIAHKAVISELGEFHKFKNGLVTNNLHTNKASWLRWLGTILTEWETKPTPLHRQYADELSGFLAEIDPQSSKCPFRLKRSSDEDPRPTYSALDARTRLAIFRCLCKWGLLKRSYFVDESMRSSFSTSARAWNLGQDDLQRTYFWFPTLDMNSIFRSNEKQLKRLSHDEETLGEAIESLFAEEPPEKLNNWLKFIQHRVLASSSEIQLSMDQNEVQEEEENRVRKSSIMDYELNSNNHPSYAPPTASSHYLDPFGSLGLFRSVVAAEDIPSRSGRGDVHPTGLLQANSASRPRHGGTYSGVVGVDHVVPAAQGVMGIDHASTGAHGIRGTDKASGPQGGGMYSQLMSQSVNYGYSFPFQAGPYVVMDQVRLVQPVPIILSMDHLQTNQSAYVHSPYLSHNPPMVSSMANGTMVMPSASNHNGHNSSALATLLSAAQQVNTPWVQYQMDDSGSLNQQARPSSFNRPTADRGSDYQAVKADEDETFTAAQRESEGSSKVEPNHTGVTPLKLPDWLKDTQSGAKVTGGNTTMKSGETNLPSTDRSRLFKQPPPSSSSEYVDHFRDDSQMLPPPVRRLPPFSDMTDTTSSASTNENIGSATSQHSSPMRRSPKIAVRSSPTSFFPSDARPVIGSSSASSSSPFKLAPGSTNKTDQSPAGARYKPSIVYDDNSAWSDSSKGTGSAAGSETNGTSSNPFVIVGSKVNSSPDMKKRVSKSDELNDLIEGEPVYRKKAILTQENMDDESD